jgi:steroid 5-alpha reductase family enzyme
MKKTINILMGTVVLIPVAAFYVGTMPDAAQIHILKNVTLLVAGAIAYTFIVGQISGNNSQVDKLWSILPAIYAWFMTAQADFNPRMVLMSVLVTIWAVRLTYNFARRGAYTWRFWAGEEDYRWEILRQRPGFKNKWIWMLFNLFFICIYQNLLIFLFTLPVLGCLTAGAAPLDSSDYLLAIAMIVFILIEYVADQQQYNFQTEKYRRLKSGESLGIYEKGFISSGLWTRVRHPNYAAEQMIWIVFYLFTVSATGEWLNWTVSGCILLVILFKGSSDFSEEISASKYPEYINYRKSAGRFVPKLF